MSIVLRDKGEQDRRYNFGAAACDSPHAFVGARMQRAGGGE